MRKSRNEKGFTLLEILVALSILSIGLLGMAGLTTSIIHGNTLSKKVTTATTLGQDRMEHFRRLGYSRIPVTGVPDPEPYNTIANYSAYRRVSIVANTLGPGPDGIIGTPDDVIIPGLMTITVTVYWNSDAGSVELKTILAQ